MTPKTLSHVHRFVPATVPDRPPILLLHGTGGDEDDLVPLGSTVAPGAALLSVRGKVLEGGMPRFFRRLAEGVFDEQDLTRRLHDLADFVQGAREAYDLGAPIALGFSNGANVAAAMLQLRPEALAGAVLLRAMVPFKNPPRVSLDETPILILSGATDPIVPNENAARLATILGEAGAIVEHRVLPTGHNLTQADCSAAKAWLEQRATGPRQMAHSR